MTPNETDTSAPEPVTASEETLLQKNKPLLLTALQAGGATGADVHYEGVGDSGDVSSVVATMVGDQPFDLEAEVTIYVERHEFRDGQHHLSLTEESMPIEDALRDFVNQALEQHHGGWENGDGGAGQVIFRCGLDGEPGSVTLQHSNYFTESDYTETEL